MELIDTHSHLYLEHFNDDRAETIERAKVAGISNIILPNIDSTTLDRLLDMAREYKDYCLPAIGLHPTSVKKNYREELALVEKEAKSKDKYIAIGEIGLDYYWDKRHKKEQVDSFVYQLELAAQLELPVIIHARDAFPEIFDVMEKAGIKGLRGVFHSFSGTGQDAERAINMGFFIGINGIVTFKNATLAKIVKEHVPLEKLLVETDAPFLAPVPKRGKRNESGYALHVAKKIAEIKNQEIAEIARITTGNARELFFS